MKILIVYDSQFGNTEKVAQTIATELGEDGNAVRLIRVESVSLEDIIDQDLLLVGSPTQKWNTTEAVTLFLEKIPPNLLSNKKAAAFDTRMRTRLGGSAAVKIERLIKQNGGKIISPAGAFYVLEKGGPLGKGELDRAAEWARGLRKKQTKQEGPTNG